MTLVLVNDRKRFWDGDREKWTKDKDKATRYTDYAAAAHARVRALFDSATVDIVEDRPAGDPIV